MFSKWLRIHFANPNFSVLLMKIFLRDHVNSHADMYYPQYHIARLIKWNELSWHNILIEPETTYEFHMLGLDLLRAQEAKRQCIWEKFFTIPVPMIVIELTP